MAKHNDTGVQGETVAGEFLENLGYVILDRNWRHRHYELDLVARTGDVIVIVEVKTRTTLYAGEPELSVTRMKQRTLIKAANAYVIYNGINLPVRFDIVGVVVRGKSVTLNHIIDAFYAMM